MSSTRNKNTYGDYNLEKKMNENIANYNLYPYSSNGFAYSPAMPNNGLNMGNMHAYNLSYNATDIESSLRGINSTNLEESPNPTFTAELKNIRTFDFIKKHDTIIPEPLVIEKNQRPNL